MENCEIHLPEDIIQHIQSLLTGKEAAQTSILSKSWYRAWLTRPNLDFDQHDFSYKSPAPCDENKLTGKEAAQTSLLSKSSYRVWLPRPNLDFNQRNFSYKSPAPCDENKFWEFATKAMQRYESLNQKIDSLRLRVNGKRSDVRSVIAGKKLILKAMKLGATDIHLEHGWGNNVFALPPEVLRSETLTRLSVRGCRIDLGMNRRITCSSLKSLNLSDCDDKYDIIQGIISSCPLIENLSLLFNKSRKVPTFDGPMEFHKLKSLFLGRVWVDALFFCDFSSKFPCLKDLSIHHFRVHGCEEIQLSSTSLECISFEYIGMLTASFDVPCLRNIKFKSVLLPNFFLPNLAFKKYSREWKSHIFIEASCQKTSWFIQLKELLAKLSQHEISLSLNIGGFIGNRFDYSKDVQGFPTPIVLEDLVLRCSGPSSGYSAFVDGLFWSCRPKFITLELTTKGDFLDNLCKILIQRVSGNSGTPLGLPDIEAVNVDLFNKILAKWQPLPLETLLCASVRRESISKIRLQLKWR